MGGVQGHGEGGFPGHQPGARRGEMHPHDMVKSPTWKSLGQAPESTKFAKDEDTALSLTQNYIPREEI